MTIFELAALTAATLWAFGGLISASPSAALGAISYGHTRMVMVSIMLGLYVLIMGTWRTVGIQHLEALIISGIIGIFLGDTALFLTLNRLGPRRTAILFSLNAPISAILGWLFLEQKLTALEVGGIIITTIGVTMAVMFGKRKSQLHSWENIKGPLWIGVSIGIFAAFCQSVGTIIASPIMAQGVDPFAASLIRVGIAAIFLTVTVMLPFKVVKPLVPFDVKILTLTALSGLVGMGLGMSLILFAISGGEVGIISTLSATTPAILLPLLWIKTKERPALGAWAGAGLVIVGSGLLFI